MSLRKGIFRLTRRTQPPLFTQMVADYYSATNNATFLSRMIPYIDKELAWWRTNRSVIVTKNGHNYTLFQYRVGLRAACN